MKLSRNGLAIARVKITKRDADDEYVFVSAANPTSSDSRTVEEKLIERAAIGQPSVLKVYIVGRIRPVPSVVRKSGRFAQLLGELNDAGMASLIHASSAIDYMRDALGIQDARTSAADEYAALVEGMSS